MFLFILFIALITPIRVFAAQTLLPRKSIRVYAEPNKDGEVIRTLERGDQVPMSPVKYEGGWRKIRLRIDGQLREAWVRGSDLKGSIVQGAEGGSGKGSQVYHRRYGVGVKLALSYMSQAARTFQSSDASVSIGNSSGISNFFGIYVDVPMKEQLQMRVELLMRNTNLTGTTVLSGAEPQPYLLKQSFIGLAAFGKFYFSKVGGLWAGAGAEFSKGTQVSLTYSGNISVPAADLPNFFIVQTGFGADFNLAGNFYVLPEIRAGIVLTTKPMIYNVEGLLNIGYAF